jgi:hypothetical protein
MKTMSIAQIEHTLARYSADLVGEGTSVNGRKYFLYTDRKTGSTLMQYVDQMQSEHDIYIHLTESRCKFNV